MVALYPKSNLATELQRPGVFQVVDARDFAKEVADLVPGVGGVDAFGSGVGQIWLLFDTLCYFNREIPRI